MFSAVPQVFFIQYFLFHFLCQCTNCGVERERTRLQIVSLCWFSCLSNYLLNIILCSALVQQALEQKHHTVNQLKVQFLGILIAACNSNFSQTCSFAFEDKATNTNLHEKIYLKLVLNYWNLLYTSLLWVPSLVPILWLMTDFSANV